MLISALYISCGVQLHITAKQLKKKARDPRNTEEEEWIDYLCLRVGEGIII